MDTVSPVVDNARTKAFFILPSIQAFEDANIMVNLFPDVWSGANEKAKKHCLIESTSLGTLLFVEKQQNEVTNNESLPHATICLSERYLYDLKDKISTSKHLSCQSLVSNYGSSESVLLTLPGGSILLFVSSLSNSEISQHVLFYVSKRENERNFFEEEKKEDNSLDRITAHFPTLNTMSLYNDKFVLMKPNSVLGTDVNTDLFVGKIMLIMRSEQDSYFQERIFNGRRRRFEIQFQGRLKRLPEGILYCGGEITGKMKLGLMTKGLCNVILNLLHKMTRHMYYSFGNNDNSENARIVFPCWTFVDRLIITPMNETPPKLGEIIYESPESVKLRKKSTNSLGDWKMNHTYTMSFNSSNIDLPSWSLVNLPCLQNTDLHKFWGDSNLRIVMYDVPKKYAQEKHLQKRLNYGFNLEISHLRDQPSKQDFRTQTASEEDSNMSDNDDDDDSVSGNTFFFDSTGDIDSDDDNTNSTDRIPIQFISTAMDLSKLSPNHICPAWVELYRPRHRYEILFAFCMHSSIKFRSVSQFTNIFGCMRDNLKHPRLSSYETQRRLLGSSIYVRLMEQDDNINSHIAQFGQLSSYYDTYFLKHRKLPSPTNNCTTLSGFVARALSEHHWREEWATLSSDNSCQSVLHFYHPDQKKPHFTLLIKNIVNVCLCNTEDSLFKDHQMFQIETLGQTTYLLMNSEDEVKRWVGEINNLRKRCAMNPSVSLLNMVDYDGKEFLHKSSTFKCKQRRILNYRTFLFDKSNITSLDPCTLSQLILTKALSLSNLSDASTFDLNRLVDFLNLTSQLKAVNISILSDNQRVAFFLNLYHTIIAHAFLVLSPPNNTFKFVTFFNKIAYQINDDILSLAELEHNVIRAKMAHPSPFLSKWIIPRNKSTLYPEMELSKSDYRFNFAMNCGSVSIHHIGIQIYTPDTLEEQLDYAVKLYFGKTVKSKFNPLTNILMLELPKVCQWYGDDFRVVTGINNNSKSWDSVVHALKQYFPEQVREVLEKNKGVSCHTKFASFEYTCQPLTLDEK